MTARQIFEGMLTELSKVNAPSLLLEDFNYFFNKAINQYINKRYNIYDVNQQTTDDIRVLKSTSVLTPELSTIAGGLYGNIADGAESYLSKANSPIASLYGATYEVNLPKDYLHILNCICVYHVKKQFKCYDKDSYVQFAAKRLTSDTWSSIINDYYNRPLPTRPYYYIHNVNTNHDGTLPTNPFILGATTVQPSDPVPANEPATGESTGDSTMITLSNPKGTDMNGLYKVTSADGSVGDNSNFQRSVTISGQQESLVERNIATRYGNPSNVRMEIRYGRDNSLFELKQVLIDYIKVPQYIRLTQEQLDLTEDTSQIMEFPDYVCQEIINELVHIVMENTADPRLQSHIPVTQSIANPAQAQAQPQAQAQA